MEKLTSFKEFVKKNPILVKYVRENKMTWQKFYELYDLYGEEGTVWDTYLKQVKTEKNMDLVNFIKTLDLDAFQESINSVRRVIGVLQDLNNNESKAENKKYEPRPIYKHFED